MLRPLRLCCPHSRPRLRLRNRSPQSPGAAGLPPPSIPPSLPLSLPLSLHPSLQRGRDAAASGTRRHPAPTRPLPAGAEVVEVVGSWVGWLWGFFRFGGKNRKVETPFFPGLRFSVCSSLSAASAEHRQTNRQRPFRHPPIHQG